MSRAVVGAVVTWLFVVIVAMGILAVGNFARVTGGLSSAEECWLLIRRRFWLAVTAHGGLVLLAAAFSVSVRRTSFWARGHNGFTIGLLALVVGAGLVLLATYVLALAGDACRCTAATC